MGCYMRLFITLGGDNVPHDKQPIFRLKQAFPDITSSEIQFLSKALAQMLALCNEAHLPKTFAPGERWPSNQYDGRLLWAAAALLTMRRAGMPVRAVLEANASRYRPTYLRT